MKVSILVCTYNRAPFLDKLLECLINQNFRGEHEIIVVDNNSADETKAVFDKWMAKANPQCPIRYKFVAEQGLSHARNAGVDVAAGEIVAFIDDDAIPGKDWLQQIIDNFADGSLASLGGKVIPDWSGPPPGWLSTPEHWPAIGGSNYGEKHRVMSKKMCPLGGNMAVRTEWCRSVGGFNPRFGKIGRNMGSFEEVEFANRIRQKGGKMIYDPKMIIYHHVPNERMTKTYVSERRYWDGHTLAAFEKIRGGRRRQWMIGFLLLGLHLLRDLPGLVINTVLGKRDRAYIHFIWLKRAQGYFQEVWDDLKLGRQSSGI